MTVVSDTSPINYLILIDSIDVLPTLFGRVTTVPSVIAELRHARSPIAVRQWSDTLPAWLDVKSAAIPLSFSHKLHPGESETLSLARELGADLVLLDDWAARREAGALDLKIAGTLGILQEAGIRGLLEIENTIFRLRATTYRGTEELYHRVIENVKAGRRN